MALGSFLKKLAGPAAGIATSFLPGVGPALAPIVGGAVGNLANRGGGGGGSSSTAIPSADPEEAARRKDIAGGLQGLQTTATDASGRLITGAEGDISGARGFYSKLASGDPAATGAAFAPQLNQARQLHQGAIEQIEQFQPRSGARDVALGRERIARAGTMSGILSQAPVIGAQGLQQLAQTGGQLGLGSGQLGLGAGTTAANIGFQGEQLGLDRARVGQGQAAIDLQRRGQNIGIAETIGQGVGDILTGTGLGGKLANVFGGGPKRANIPVSDQQAAANVGNVPTSGAIPYTPPPNIPMGPVSQQYNTAHNTALKTKKPLNALAA